MIRATEVVILGEDDEQTEFARKFLNAQGVVNAKIRVIPNPNGKGAGTAHVVKNFPERVMAYRKKRNSIHNGLVVIIDADVSSVEQRYKELNRTLQKAALESRQEDERIVFWIPKRNIETWLCFLTGITVDEILDYKKTHQSEIDKSKKKAAIKGFAEKWPNSLPPKMPEALRLGMDEFHRIEKTNE
jgi:hypothetical protein